MPDRAAAVTSIDEGMCSWVYARTPSGFCRRITPPVCTGRYDRASRGAIRRIVRSAPTSSTRSPDESWRFPSITGWRVPDVTSLFWSVPPEGACNNSFLYSTKLQRHPTKLTDQYEAESDIDRALYPP
jgi:hypothetical protein